MTELELVRWIARQGHGIGDDCAILPAGRHELLVTTDLFLEDVHFRRIEPPATLGHRTLARGLSDLAAMGADPRWCLLSLALPSWAEPAWIRRFFAGFLKLARRHGVTLVGGDTSHSERLAADIVAIGTAPRGRALRRDTARPGDAIYVSGVLGSQPALPAPRCELGRHLRSRASACMDLSDGLALDLHRLALASGVAAAIDHPLPAARGATLDDALYRGEDYELLFTSRRRLARFGRLPLTRIGSIVRGQPGALTLFGLPLEPRGYDHFANR